MGSERAFIFHMCIPCAMTFCMVPRSSSSANVKVKYHGHIFRKMTVWGRNGGISVSQTHVVQN